MDQLEKCMDEESDCNGMEELRSGSFCVRGFFFTQILRRFYGQLIALCLQGG